MSKPKGDAALLAQAKELLADLQAGKPLTTKQRELVTELYGLMKPYLHDHSMNEEAPRV